MVESSLVINRTLDNDYVPLSFLIKDNEEELYKDIFDRCPKDIVIYEVKEDIFNQLKGFILIKGILGIFKRKDDLNINDICLNSRRVVVLEDIENPTNVGSIIRNAAGLYCDGILVTDDTCNPLYRRSIRVSMGNVFNINWAIVDKDTYIDELKKLGYKIVSFALNNNSISLDDERLTKEDKLAIILGSEGYGLKEDTIKKSDYVCKIDMKENIDSLNVASASAIALYELCKKPRT